MMKNLQKIFPPLLSGAVLVMAWAGVSFSPGFSESFAACFITSQVLAMAFENVFGRVTALAGALLLAAGSYIYAAGDDCLNTCLWAALGGMLLCSLLEGRQQAAFSEKLLRTVLFGAALFTVFCGLFSTALLPAGLGAMLCFAARFSQKAREHQVLAGIFLCSLFMLAPMCFPGGAFV